VATFTVKFSTDNAAFADDYTGEVRTILEAVIDALEGGAGSGNLKDINGNLIGYFKRGGDNA